MFGFPSPPNHTNAIIMILTLKLIGLAFEVHDSSKKEKDFTVKEGMDKVKKPCSSSAVPSLEDQFHYGFNHVGLITGPYYRFSTLNGIQSMECFIKSSTWCPSFSTSG